MTPPRERGGRAPERRFLLATAPDQGVPTLAPGEDEHALRVVRLGVGDRLVGLDRRGRAWPLVVRAASRRALELEPAGAPESEPAPGEPGAALPWVELRVSPPRGARLEGMVERLVQLGVGALLPLRFERTPPGALAWRAERLERIATEALKQCGRLWPLELLGAASFEEALERPAAAVVALDPRAPRSLAEVLEELPRGTRARPLALVVGPEGGASPDELARLDAAGAVRARVAPHVLRIETAAEAAAAAVASRC